MGKNTEVHKALATFSQVSLSVLSPIVACLIIAKLFVDKLGWPDYVIVIGIALGAVSGLYSMIKLVLSLTKKK